MNPINPILLVYTPELTEGYLFELEKTREYDPDYMGEEEWCFTATHPDSNHQFEGIGNCGWWDKLSNLLFVDDHDNKIEKIIKLLNKTQKKLLKVDDILEALKNESNN
jgi:hypothetical protein